MTDFAEIKCPYCRREIHIVSDTKTKVNHAWHETSICGPECGGKILPSAVNPPFVCDRCGRNYSMKEMGYEQ